MSSPRPPPKLVSYSSSPSRRAGNREPLPRRGVAARHRWFSKRSTVGLSDDASRNALDVKFKYYNFTYVALVNSIQRLTIVFVLLCLLKAPGGAAGRAEMNLRLKRGPCLSLKFVAKTRQSLASKNGPIKFSPSALLVTIGGGHEHVHGFARSHHRICR
jgi:hypothetical protein